jgi:hypothetical protein
LFNANSRVNASCEKLPRTRLITNDRDKHSNSIIIRKKNDTSIATPQKPYTNVENTNIPRNKSNISLYEGHREDLLEPANPLVVNRLMPKSIYHKDLNKTINGDKVTFKDGRNSLNVVGKNPPIAYNTSSNKRIPRDNESTTLSGLSMGDEWTEIELYNGILSKMRKDHEIASKRNKIQETRNTLKDQITQKKEVKKRELEEKEKYDVIIANSVNNDKREGDWIKLKRQRKIDQERSLRDEQLFLEHKKKAMYADNKINYEHSLVEKLQKEIKEEKDNAVKKRKKELTE